MTRRIEAEAITLITAEKDDMYYAVKEFTKLKIPKPYIPIY